jgi:hypothetical protein
MKTIVLLDDGTWDTASAATVAVVPDDWDENHGDPTDGIRVDTLVKDLQTLKARTMSYPDTHVTVPLPNNVGVLSHKIIRRALNGICHPAIDVEGDLRAGEVFAYDGKYTRYSYDVGANTTRYVKFS